jgi:hypothetical protein
MELRELGREVHFRSVFSARMTNAEAVQELANLTDELIAGKIDMGTGIVRMYEKLKSLGYTPEGGFPDQVGGVKVPPAVEGSLRDLTSEKRLKLMLQTNMRMAQGYGRWVEGNTDYARKHYPAWELIRVYARTIERGSQESHTAGWHERWQDAGDAVKWKGAIAEPMMARKDSPIWEALGDGAGGYNDCLGNPYPPFAFGSGMGVRPVARAEWEELSDEGGTPEEMKARLAPTALELEQAFDRLSPDLRATLEGKWAA